MLFVVLGLAGKLVATAIERLQELKLLHSVAVLVPVLVNVPPLAPAIVPVHCIALTAWKLSDAGPPSLAMGCVGGASGVAGPKDTALV